MYLIDMKLQQITNCECGENYVSFGFMESGKERRNHIPSNGLPLWMNLSSLADALVNYPNVFDETWSNHHNQGLDGS